MRLSLEFVGTVAVLTTTLPAPPPSAPLLLLLLLLPAHCKKKLYEHVGANQSLGFNIPRSFKITFCCNGGTSHFVNIALIFAYDICFSGF